MKHYILHIIKPNLKYKLSYRNGKFHRLERQSGFIDSRIWRSLTKVIPLEESDIQTYNDTFIDRVSIIALEKKPKSLWHKYVGSWKSFYQQHYGIYPKFDGVEGRHLKQLIAYLESLEGSPEGAFTIWEQLLTNWDKLDEFHKQNADIKYINSNINRIINNVKKSTNKANYSDNFKRKILDGLRS